MSAAAVLCRRSLQTSAARSCYKQKKKGHKDKTTKYEWESSEMPVYEYGSKHPVQSLYGWGLAASGALGVEEFVTGKDHRGPLTAMFKPCSIRFPKANKITDFSCGYGFTVISVRSKLDDKLYGCGLNTNSQLGFHPKKGNSGSSMPWLVKPTPISLPLAQMESTSVTHVGCGRAHTVVATDNEGIFTFGNNAHGQCGRTAIEDENYENNTIVHQIDSIPGTVKQIVCGMDHSLILCTDGSVYSFGAGHDGQLGRGVLQSSSRPDVVGGDIKGEKIVSISCAADTVLAVSDKGDIFGWGAAESRQFTKATDAIQVHTPIRLPFNNVGKVISAAAGGSTCALVNAEGIVYVFGLGIVGQGPAVTCRFEPSPIPAPIFMLNEFNADLKVIQVVAGLDYMTAITNKGDLFAWGKNRHGVLGLGNQDDHFFPFKVSISRDVKRVSCGPDHMMCLNKPWV